MKKVLLGSSALVAAGLFAVPAAAQLELTISGSVDVNFGVVDEDGPSLVDAEDVEFNRRDYGGRTDVTLNFNTVATADNGLRYGSRINIDDSDDNVSSDGSIDSFNNASTFTIDEAWLFLSGSFGEIRLGDKEGVAPNFRLTIPTVGGGAADGDWDNYVGVGTPETGTGFLLGDNDSARITYFFEWEGLTAGASYAPASGDSLLNSTAQCRDTDVIFCADFEDQFDIGANYTFDFDGGSVIVAATYLTADSVSAEREDIEGVSLGAQVAYDAFTIGGFYVNSFDSGAPVDDDVDDFQRWGVGATYQVGDWGFGVNYLGSSNFDGEDGWAAGGGVSYNIAPGLQAYADLVFFENEATAPDGVGPRLEADDGTVFLAGITASF
ncbi:MAG: porin [Pseudomonadota bacterium]